MWNKFFRMRLFLAHRPREEVRLADRLLEKSALRAQSARSMERDVLQLSVEEVPKRPDTFKLDTCARGTPPSPLQALVAPLARQEARSGHVEHTNGRRSHRRLCSASFELAEATVDAEDEAATPAEASSASLGEVKQPSKHELAYMRLFAACLLTKPPPAERWVDPEKKW